MSHNTFGHLFRVTTWGESHGAALGCVVDGCPPGIRFASEEIQADLDKRRPGQSRFMTQRREPDEVAFFRASSMDEDGETMIRPARRFDDDRECRPALQGLWRNRHQYRPGHADYTYEVKYGVRDYRGGGRSSARETATRVAAGALARKVVPGMMVRGALVSMGEKAIDRDRWDWNSSAMRKIRSSRRIGSRSQSLRTIWTAFANPACRSAR